MGKRSKSHKKIIKRKTRKHSLDYYFGGYKGIPTTVDGTPLAYPYDGIKTYPNTALAYTGKGGDTAQTQPMASTQQPMASTQQPMASTQQPMASTDSAYPSTGPPANGFNFLNPQVNQRGGCGCSSGIPLQGGGGKKCSTCSFNFFGKGGKKLVHRTACKCSQCKKNRFSGGSYPNQSNHGIPYPDGLTGSSWGPSPASWPGVNGVSGDRNYLAHNNYPTDVQTAIIDANNSKPYMASIGKGGKKRTRSSHQKGGDFSNFLGQDLLNIGRQFQFGLGSAYNALSGYAAPVNPLPWKDQLANTPSLSSVKASSL